MTSWILAILLYNSADNSYEWAALPVFYENRAKCEQVGKLFDTWTCVRAETPH